MTQYLDYIYNCELRRRRGGQTDRRTRTWTEHNVVSIFSGLWLLPPPPPCSSMPSAPVKSLKGAERAGGAGRGGERREGQIDRVQYERERDNSGRRSCPQDVPYVSGPNLRIE